MKLISAPTFLSDSQYRQQVIDVRMPGEYKNQCWAESLNTPLPDLQQGKCKKISTNKPITILCQSGRRAQMAAELLKKQFPACDVCVVEGGIAALANAGATLQTGSGVWSLERQVRIAAGLLTLIGILLSIIHPYFLGISIFVGAGLIFAGVTDYCGMAFLLSRMPWNK